jgi:hypothetical protein
MEGLGHRAAIDPNLRLGAVSGRPDGPWEPLANCQTSIESAAEVPPPAEPAETPSEPPGP